MIKFIADVRDSLGFTARVLNLGGGFGVRYTEKDPEIDYTKNISEIAQHIQASSAKYALPPLTVLMEPGARSSPIRE